MRHAATPTSSAINDNFKSIHSGSQNVSILLPAFALRHRADGNIRTAAPACRKESAKVHVPRERFAATASVSASRHGAGGGSVSTSRLPRHELDVRGAPAMHVTRHTSHVRRHAPHVTRHTSHVTRHTSHVTRHTPHATRHTSHVTRHTPHATVCAV